MQALNALIILVTAIVWQIFGIFLIWNAVAGVLHIEHITFISAAKLYGLVFVFAAGGHFLAAFSKAISKG